MKGGFRTAEWFVAGLLKLQRAPLLARPQVVGPIPSITPLFSYFQLIEFNVQILLGLKKKNFFDEFKIF